MPARSARSPVEQLRPTRQLSNPERVCQPAPQGLLLMIKAPTFCQPRLGATLWALAGTATNSPLWGRHGAVLPQIHRYGDALAYPEAHNGYFVAAAARAKEDGQSTIRLQEEPCIHLRKTWSFSLDMRRVPPMVCRFVSGWQLVRRPAASRHSHVSTSADTARRSPVRRTLRRPKWQVD